MCVVVILPIAIFLAPEGRHIAPPGLKREMGAVISGYKHDTPAELRTTFAVLS